MDLEKKNQEDPLTPPKVPQTPPPAPNPNQHQQQYGRNPQQGLSESDAKLWATLSHLGFVIGGFITPLVIYMIQKDKSEFVASHAREALNFQLTILAVVLGSMFLLLFGFIAPPIFVVMTFLMVGIMMIVGIGSLILGIMALLEANKGAHYKYPIAIRFVK